MKQHLFIDDEIAVIFALEFFAFPNLKKETKMSFAVCV